MDTEHEDALAEYDDFYRAGGFGYEEKRQRLEAWVKRHYVGSFDMSPGQRVLDLGCGDGFWSSILVAQGFRVDGVDISEGGIAVAKGKYPGAGFAVGNIEGELPYEKGSFDVVFWRAPSHLLVEDPSDAATADVARRAMAYVAPGGMMLMSYSSRMDGGRRAGHFDHPVSTLVKAMEAAGQIFRVEVVNNQVTVAVQHGDAPRRARARPAAQTIPPPPQGKPRAPLASRARQRLRRLIG